MSGPQKRYTTRSRKFLELLETPRYDTKGLTPSEKNDFLIKWLNNVETSTYSSEIHEVSTTILVNDNKNDNTTKDDENDQHISVYREYPSEYQPILGNDNKSGNTSKADENDQHASVYRESPSDYQPILANDNKSDNYTKGDENDQHTSVNREYPSEYQPISGNDNKSGNTSKADENDQQASVYGESPSEYQPILANDNKSDNYTKGDENDQHTSVNREYPSEYPPILGNDNKSGNTSKADENDQQASVYGESSSEYQPILANDNKSDNYTKGDENDQHTSVNRDNPSEYQPISGNDNKSGNTSKADENDQQASVYGESSSEYQPILANDSKSDNYTKGDENDQHTSVNRDNPSEYQPILANDNKSDNTSKDDENNQHEDSESIKSISMYRESESEYQPSSSSYVSESVLSSNKNDDFEILKSSDIVYNINDNEQEKLQKSGKINKEVKKMTKNEAKRNKQVRSCVQEGRNKHITKYREEESTDSEPEQEILVDCAKRNEVTGKRIRDKGHCCYFCHKIMGNLARHFELMHKNETQVAKVLVMPKNSKRRQEAFGELIRSGDFQHNCQVMTVKRGELILVRRPSEKEKSNLSYSSYGPCPDCLGFMMKKRLWHHIKYNCKSKITTTPDEQKRKIISESTALLHGIISPEYCTEYNDNILAKFKNDDISEVCRNDATILKFGYLQFEKYGNTQCELIRQTMRQLGRFLIRAKSMNPEIKDLADCLLPKHFDLVLVATKSLCGSSSSNTKRPEFEIPSLALKLGHAFKKCVGILKGMALRVEDLKKNEIYTCFLNLMEMEWSNKISSCALSTMYKRKFNHKQLLPLTEDLVVLTKYLDNEILKLKQNLVCNDRDYKTWRSLASCTLTRIILFNKKRSGEASKLTIEQYATRPTLKDQGTQEFLLSLSPLEKKLASTMDVVDIEGKRGSRVPVLLTPDLKSAVDLLIKTRSNVGISNNNPYVFAPANSENGHLRGHDCLRAACEQPILQHPDYITGTKLRKYIATVCQLFNLRKHEADWLARHLGHDIRVHRNFYRLHENAVETTKISRLLIAIEQGEANKYAGKSLEEINIEDLPGLNEDDDESHSKEPVLPQTQHNENDGNMSLSEDEIPLVLRLRATKKNPVKKKSSEPIDTRPAKKAKKGGKTPWTPEEIEAVLQFFKFNLKKEIIPGKEECTACMAKYPILIRRKWSDIKFYLKNYYTRNRKLIGKK